MGMAKLQRENKVRNCMFVKINKNMVLENIFGRKKGILFYIDLTATVSMSS
jgi:hypothetical protein